MMADEEGFLYPEVNLETCDNCGACERVCPLLDEHIPASCEQQRIFAATNKDRQLLARSASGGAFGALASWVLERGGIVYGAAYNEDMKVKHICAEHADELLRLHDSKYVQSELGHVFPEIKKHLQTGREVLFTGTPCQVGGLCKYLKKPYPNLLACDILCHSVASPRIFEEYIKYVEEKTKKKITHLSLRDKRNGWGVYTTRIDYQSHPSEYNSYWAGIWAMAYPHHLITRPSCHQCKFCSYDRCGDISIGDFWGIEKKAPDYDAHNGVSLLMVNTAKGRQVIDDVRGSFHLLEASREEACQPVLVAPASPSPLRPQFWADYKRRGIDYVINKYWGMSFKRRIYYHIQSFFKYIVQKR